MKSSQIDYFLALAKYKSFSKTSEMFYIAQPALSKNIKAMEEELNFPLFYRTSNGVVLTNQGKIMFEYFTRAKEEYQQTVLIAQQAATNTNKLCIGLPEAIWTDIIWEFLRSKGIDDWTLRNIRIETMNTVDIPMALFNREVDCAIALGGPSSFSSIDREQIHRISLFSSKYRLFFSVNHPAAKLNHELLPGDFKDTVLLIPVENRLLETPHGSYDIVVYFTHLLGYTPMVEYVESVSAILPNIETGYGVTILADCGAAMSRRNIQSILLDSKEAPDVIMAYIDGPKKPELEHLLIKLNSTPAN